MCNLFSCDSLRSFSAISRASASSRLIFYELCSCRLLFWSVCNAIWELAKEENQNNTQKEKHENLLFLLTPAYTGQRKFHFDFGRSQICEGYYRVSEGDSQGVRHSSLALQLIKSMAARPLLALCARGTQRSASGHHSDNRLALPPALSSLRCPFHRQKATFHQKSENVNQDAFMLFMTRYLCWQEGRPAGLLGPFQTSAPTEYKTHLLQSSFPLPTLPHTPKQLIYKNIPQQTILNIKNESSQKKQEQQRLLFLHPDWKGA